MRGLFNLTGVALLGLATQVYGQPGKPNLGRERYDASDADSAAPSWGPYLALGFVAVVIVLAAIAWLAQRSGCLNRFFPVRDADSDSATVASSSPELSNSLLNSPRVLP